MAFQLLDDVIFFPDTALAEPSGLLAFGGDLSIERLRLAYQSGIFPWYDEAPILWYSPHERCVIYSAICRRRLSCSCFDVSGSSEGKSFLR